jgi:hypothetical protein
MQQHSGRRVVLYHPRYVEGFRAALMEARADLREMHLQHLCEIANLQGQVAELREVVQLVVSVLRQQAEPDVATLRRQLEIALARLERDPNRPLN